MNEGREGVQRTPRSGGRTTGQRSTQDNRRTPVSGNGSDGGARGARHYPTQGATALKLEAAEPLRVTEVAAPRLRVAPPAPISAPRAQFVAVVVAMVVAGVFGILLINTKTNENTFEIDRLQEQQSALNNQEQQLRREIAAYDNTGNLDAAARMLGLVKAESPAYIRLPDGKIIGVPRPATGKPSVTSQDAGNAPATGTAQDPAGTAQDTTGTAPVAGG